MKAIRPRVQTRSTAAIKPRPKVAAAHYQSAEHRAWSAKVIARAGRRCERCGNADGRMIADHIIEIRDGGAPLDPLNGQCLCISCHNRKTADEQARRVSRAP